VGHLAVAVNVRYELELDVVVLMVAGTPWQKVGVVDVSPAEHRLAMVELAAADAAGVEVSTLELDRGSGATYTADTLTELSVTEPDVELFLIVGSDAAAGFDTWHRPEVVRDLATTVVVERPPRLTARPPRGWPHVTVESPLLDVSSTELRARVAAGRPIDYLTPRPVIDYIDQHGLYRGAA
jgi:nicotinate-nucleotide adenylyltransferase